MSKLFNKFFDSYRVKNDTPTRYIRRNHIGSILLFPSEINPFMEDYSSVRVFDNGEIVCDEDLAKLITYTDSHNEFMEFCLDLWKYKTNQKIYPKCIIFASSDQSLIDEKIPYKDFEPKNYLVD